MTPFHMTGLTVIQFLHLEEMCTYVNTFISTITLLTILEIYIVTYLLTKFLCVIITNIAILYIVGSDDDFLT